MSDLHKILLLRANPWIRLFLCLYFFIVTDVSTAQSSPPAEVIKAYQYYFNFELDSSRLSLNKTIENPWSFYIDALLVSTEVFISDDPELYKSNKFHESKLLGHLDKLKFTDEYTNFLRSEIKLQWAILKLKNGDEFSAFWTLKQAYSIAKENTKKHPNFMPSYKTLGLLHVLYGVFPDKYDWILSIFGIDGNVDLGLSELKKVMESDNFYSLEASLYTALLQSYLLNQTEEAVSIMESNYEKNKYLLFNYAYALILMKSAQGTKAKKILDDIAKRRPKPLKIPQVYYLYGEIFLQKNQPDLAILNYKNFTINHKGKDLIKDANFKTGICYLMKDELDKSQAFFAKARVTGRAKNEADKYAASALEKKMDFNKSLLQMRYATDGGYYENALKILEEIDTVAFNSHEISAYHYRSARLFHKIDELEKAEMFYQNAIKSQKDKNWYFAPNAALQLAIIYHLKNNDEAAKKYLRLVNDYHGYPYQSSIRQKSKSLSRSLD